MQKNRGVVYTAPASGTVSAINRGARRAFQNVVIKTDEVNDFVTYEGYKNKPLSEYSADEIRALMVESGWWSAFRTRPFQRCLLLTQPLLLYLSIAWIRIHWRQTLRSLSMSILNFLRWVSRALTRFTAQKIYLCQDPNANIPTIQSDNLEVKTFEGVHPAGNVGTHIHFVDPASANRVVWHLNYQEVISLGVLVGSGRVWTDRVVALAGPAVKNPRLLKVSLGADMNEVVEGELFEGENRVISGSPLSGRTADQTFKFLGRYHCQISALKEGRQRQLLGWHSPGFNKFSLKNIYVSKLLPKGFLALTRIRTAQIVPWFQLKLRKSNAYGYLTNPIT